MFMDSTHSTNNYRFVRPRHKEMHQVIKHNKSCVFDRFDAFILILQMNEK